MLARAFKEITAPAVKLKRSLARDDEAAGTPSQTTQPQAAASPGMIFSDFYKSPRSPLAKLRHHHPQVAATQLPTQLPTTSPDWAGAEYADLLSKDKAKQKEAVKRYLADKVHVDWDFPWPPQTQIPVVEASTQDEESQTGTTDHQGGATSPAKQVQDETRDDEGYQVDEGSELEEPPSDDGQADDLDDDAVSIYSVVSEDAVHYRPRTEWTSDFLMNEWSPSALESRLARAKVVRVSPLRMEAITVSGERISSPAMNEVSLLRETRQTASIEVRVDGRVVLPELVCDGVMVATPVGSTAYNFSAQGPILPLESALVALTPISPFRPRRWRGAILPDRTCIHFAVLDPVKRPVSAVADQREVRDVRTVEVTVDRANPLTLLFDPEHALDDRIAMEQFAI